MRLRLGEQMAEALAAVSDLLSRLRGLGAGSAGPRSRAARACRAAKGFLALLPAAALLAASPDPAAAQEITESGTWSSSPVRYGEWATREIDIRGAPLHESISYHFTADDDHIQFRDSEGNPVRELTVVGNATNSQSFTFRSALFSDSSVRARIRVRTANDAGGPPAADIYNGLRFSAEIVFRADRRRDPWVGVSEGPHADSAGARFPGSDLGNALTVTADRGSTPDLRVGPNPALRQDRAQDVTVSVDLVDDGGLATYSGPEAVVFSAGSWAPHAVQFRAGTANIHPARATLRFRTSTHPGNPFGAYMSAKGTVFYAEVITRGAAAPIDADPPASLDMTEGDSAEVRVRLGYEPGSDSVTVVATPQGGTKLGVLSPSSRELVFTSGDWKEHKTFVVTVREDSQSGLNTQALLNLSHSSSDARFPPHDEVDITVSIEEDDGVPLFVETFPSGPLEMDEGGELKVSIRLSGWPEGGWPDDLDGRRILGALIQTAEPEPESGRSFECGDVRCYQDDGTAILGLNFIFTPDNWGEWQVLTLTATADADDVPEPDKENRLIFSVRAYYPQTILPETREVELPVAISDDDFFSVATVPPQADGPLRLVEGEMFGLRVIPTGTPHEGRVTVRIAPGSDMVSVEKPFGATLVFDSSQSPPPSFEVSLLFADDDAINASPTLTTDLTLTFETEDPFYDEAPPVALGVDMVDDEGTLEIVPAAGPLAFGEGEGVTLSVKLTAEPSSDRVTVRVYPREAPLDVLGQPLATLQFTAADWEARQLVTLTVADDEVPNPDLDTAVSLSVETDDEAYQAAKLATADYLYRVLVKDDDEGTLVTDPAGGTISFAEGGTSEVSVRLSHPPHSDPVTVRLRAGDPAVEFRGLPAATLVFSRDEWDSDQVVTLSAAADGIPEFDIDTVFSLSVETADVLYEGEIASEFAVEVADDIPVQVEVMPADSLEVVAGGVLAVSIRLSHWPQGGWPEDPLLYRPRELLGVLIQTTEPEPEDSRSFSCGDCYQDDGRAVFGLNFIFNEDSYSTWQVLTLTATADGDDVPEPDVENVLRFTARTFGASSFFLPSTREIPVSVTDDDHHTLATDPARDAGPLRLVEGERFRLEVTPTGVPRTDPVTVRIVPGSDRVMVVSPAAATLVFDSTQDPPPTFVVSLQLADDLVINASPTLATDLTLSIKSGDHFYDGAPPVVLAAEMVDDEGTLVADPAEGPLEFTEGDGVTLSVALSLPPESSVVTVHVQPRASPLEVLGPPLATLQFTGTNWNVQQHVTLTVDDDDEPEPTLDTAVTLSVETDDDAYQAAKAARFEYQVLVADNDEGSLVTNPTGGTIMFTEGGASEVSVKLSNRPQSDTVTVRLRVGDPNVVFDGLADDTLVFSTVTWNDYQVVTLSVAGDDIPEVRIETEFSLSVETDDALFEGEIVSSFPVEVVDDDILTVETAPSGTLELDAGGELAVSVRLSFWPEDSFALGDTEVLQVRVQSAEPDVNPIFSCKSNCRYDGVSRLTHANFPFSLRSWYQWQELTITAPDDDDDIPEPDTENALNISILTPGDGSSFPMREVVTLPLVFSDDDEGGLVTDPPPRGPLTFEEGDSAEVSVKLTHAPRSQDVTVHVLDGSDDLAYYDLDDAKLVFNTDNWDGYQVVTLTVDEDTTPEVELMTPMSLSVETGDEYFEDEVAVGFDVIVTDDDQGGLEYDPPDGPLGIDEGGVLTVSVRLTHSPSSQRVTVRITSGDAALLVYDPSDATLEFDMDNWISYQQVTLSVSQDDDARDLVTDVTLSVETGDAFYQAAMLNPKVFAVEIDDDDTAGLAVSPAGPVDVEIGGPAVGFDLSLESSPSEGVAVEVELVPASAVPAGVVLELDPASPASFDFGPDSWSAAQRFEVQARYADPSNPVDIGSDIPFRIELSTNTSDGDYRNLTGTVNGTLKRGFHLLLTEPADPHAGYWHSVGVALSRVPAHTVTLTLTSAAAGIELRNDPETVVLSDTSVGELEFRLTVWEGDREVRVNVEAESDDPFFDPLEEEIAFTVDGAGADVRPALGVRLSGESSFSRIGDTGFGGTVSVFLIEGSSAEFDFGFDLFVPQSGDDVMVETADAGGDDRVSFDPAPQQFSFTASEIASGRAQRVRINTSPDGSAAGSKALRLTQSSADEAYSLHAEQAGGAMTVLVSVVPAIDGRLVVDPDSSASFFEGNSAQVGVRLSHAPLTSNVTVTVTPADARLLLHLLPDSRLTFTQGNWNVEQFLTLTVTDNDADEADLSTELALAVRSEDAYYRSAADAVLDVIVRDDDGSGSLVVTPSESLSFREGGSAQVMVALSEQPLNQNVTVHILPRVPSLKVDEPSNARLEFTITDWMVAQEVVVSSPEDGDTADISSVVTLSAESGEDIFMSAAPVLLQVDVDDNDGTLEVMPAEGTALAISEGGAITLSVRLSDAPDSDTVTVHVQPRAAPLEVHGPATERLEFTTAASDWSSWKAATLTVGTDDLPEADIVTAVTLSVATDDAFYQVAKDNRVEYAISLGDDDEGGLVVSPLPSDGTLTFTEGDSVKVAVQLSHQPLTDAVTVHVLAGDADLSFHTLTDGRLEFTQARWNVNQMVTLTVAEDSTPEETLSTSFSLSVETADELFEDEVVVEFDVEVADDDEGGLETVPASGPLGFSEGDAVTVSVRLTNAPSSRQVTVSVRTGSAAVSVLNLGSDPSLEFDSTDHGIFKAFTLTVSEDDVPEANLVTDVTLSLHTDDALFEDDVSVRFVVNVRDDDEGGLVTNPAPRGPLSFAEGDSVEVSVRLTHEPSSLEVTVHVLDDSPDLTYLGLSPARLVFDDSDWYMDKVITLTVAEDDEPEVDIAAVMSLSIKSGDEFYEDDAAVGFDVSVTDDDEGALEYVPADGLLEIDEGGAITVSVRLTAEPNNQRVTVRVSSGDAALAVHSPADATLEFESGNWSGHQEVVLSVSEDDDARDLLTDVTFTVETGDEFYQVAAGSPKVFSVRGRDNDAAGLAVSPAGPVDVEIGSDVGFDLSLDSSPSANVAVRVELVPDSAVPAGVELELVPAGPATFGFGSADWSAPQQFRVRARYTDPAVPVDIGADIGFVLNLSSTSSDGDYSSQAETVSGTLRRGYHLLLTAPADPHAGYWHSVGIALSRIPDKSVTVTLSSTDSGIEFRDDPATVVLGGTASEEIEFRLTVWDADREVHLYAEAESDDPFFDPLEEDIGFTVAGAGAGVRPALGVRLSGESSFRRLGDSGFGGTVSVFLIEGDTAEFDFGFDLFVPQSGDDVMVNAEGPAGDDRVSFDPAPRQYGFTPSEIASGRTEQIRIVTSPDGSAAGSKALRLTQSSSDEAYSLHVEQAGGAMTVLVSVVPDIDGGLEVSPESSVTFIEGGSAEVMVRLSEAPLSVGVTVTVTPLDPALQLFGLPDATLVFAPGDWSEAQVVTLTVADNDVEGGDLSTELTLSVISDDAYYLEAKDSPVVLDVTARDDDGSGALVVSPAGRLSVTEGEAVRVMVELSRQPLTVGVTVSIDPRDSSLEVGAPSDATLVFTADDWDTGQAVEIRAPEDDDTANFSSVVTLNVESNDGLFREAAANPVELNVDVDDNDGTLEVIPAEGTPLSIAEGGAITVSVRLSDEPDTDAVTVHVRPRAAPLAVHGPAPPRLEFTAANHRNWQSATLTVGLDSTPEVDVVTAVTLQVATDDAFYQVAKASPVEYEIALDDDDEGGMVTSPLPSAGTLTFEEGEEIEVTVRLTHQPRSEVVTLHVLTGDPALMLRGLAVPRLEFTRTDWSDNRMVTLFVADDAAPGADLTTSLSLSIATDDVFYEDEVAVGFDVEVTDDDEGGLVTDPVPADGALSFSEGDAVTVSVRLTAAPRRGTVTVSVLMDDAEVGLGSLSPARLEFTAANWESFQQVTVTVDEDTAPEPNISARLELSVFSDDDFFEDDVVVGFDVNVADDDEGTLVTDPSARGPLAFAEGDSAALSVRLSHAPRSQEVTVHVLDDHADLEYFNLSPARLVFDSFNWSRDQVVTLTVREDFVPEVDIDTSMSLSVETDDEFYEDDVVFEFDVDVTDDDEGALDVVPTSGPLEFAEGGRTRVSVRLTAEPNDKEVTVRIRPENPGLVVEDPTDATLVFDLFNWNSYQEVSLTSPDDDDARDLSTMVTLTVESDDEFYQAVKSSPTRFVVNVSDNDASGLAFSPAGPVDVEIGGDAVSFDLSLESSPSSNVAVRVALVPASAVPSSVALELMPASPATFNFSSGNWSDTQQFSVRARYSDPSNPVDIDSDIPFRIELSTNTSDGDYRNLTGTVNGTLLRGFHLLVTEPSDPHAGYWQSVGVALSRVPTQDVTVTLTSADTGIEFRNDPETVVLSGTETGQLEFRLTVWEGNRAVRINAEAQSGDPGFDPLEEALDFTVAGAGAGVRPALGVRLSGESSFSRLGDTGFGGTVSVFLIEGSSAEFDFGFDLFEPRSGDDVMVETADAGGDDRVTFDPAPQQYGFIPSQIASGHTERVVINTSTDGSAAGSKALRLTQSSADEAYSLHVAQAGGVMTVLVSVVPDIDGMLEVDPDTSVAFFESGSAEIGVQLSDAPLSVNVTVTVTPLDARLKLFELPDAKLVFTPDDWDVEQFAVLTVGDDDIEGNDLSTQLRLEVLSSDSYYQAAAGTPVVLDVTARDNDVDGVLVVDPAGALSLTEGGSERIMVELSKQPLNRNVTVHIEPRDASLEVTSPSDATLVFTTSDWDAGQAVEIRAPEDGDTANFSSVVTLRVDSDDDLFQAAKATPVQIQVDVEDNDGVVERMPDAGPLAIAEGGAATISVRLSDPPDSDPVRVHVQPRGAPLEVRGPPGSGVLEFTAANFGTWQHAVITVDQDDVPEAPLDTAVTLSVETDDAFYQVAKGAPYEYAVRLSDDDDGGLDVFPASGPLEFAEGNDVTVSVRLTAEPNDRSVTVRIRPDTAELLVHGPADATLVFTSINWENYQEVTLSVAEDDDSRNLSARVTLTVESDDAFYQAVKNSPTQFVVNVSDSDTAGLAVSPGGPVNVEIGGDAAEFGLSLESSPSSNVAVRVALAPASAVPSGVVLELDPRSPATFDYNDGNWSSTQQFSVRARYSDPSNPVDIDSDIPFRIELSATSGDSDYGGQSETVNGTLLRGFHLLLTTPTDPHAGYWQSFGVALSRTPTFPVTVTLTSSDTGMEFRNTPETVVLSGTETGMLEFRLTVWEGDRASRMNVEAQSGDPGFDPLEEEVGFTIEGAGDGVRPALGVRLSGESSFSRLGDTGFQGTVSVFLIEGQSASFDLGFGRFEPQSGAGVMVDLAEASGDGRVSFTPASPHQYTFTGTQIASGHTERVQISTSTDGSAAGSKALRLTQSSSDEAYSLHVAQAGGVMTVLVSVVPDIDGMLEVDPDSSVAFIEGGSAQVGVQLSDAPLSENVTVTLTPQSNRLLLHRLPDSRLVFTPSDWDTEQFVTLTIADNDSEESDLSTRLELAVLSSDTYYQAARSAPVLLDVAVRDDDGSGRLEVAPAGRLSIVEGGSAQVMVALSEQPLAEDVTVHIEPQDPGLLVDTPTDATLVFDTGNWDAAQAVVISSPEDGDTDDLSSAVVLRVESDDEPYQDAVSAPHEIQVAVDDNDGVVEVDPARGSSYSLAEGGAVTVSVRLSDEPDTDAVTVHVQPEGAPLEVHGPPGARLEFGASDWGSWKAATLTVRTDDVPEENIDTAFTLSVATDDAFYQVAKDAPVRYEVRLPDDDEGGLVTDPLPSDGALEFEEGDGAEVAVRLTHRPNSDVVTVNVSSDDPALSFRGLPDARLEFTQGNWDADQVVTLTVAEDGDPEVDLVTRVSLSIATDDAFYEDEVAVGFDVMVSDDDEGMIETVPAPSDGTLEFAEGESVTVSVRLTASPRSQAVTVHVRPSDAELGLNGLPGSRLEFTSSDWSSYQEVTLTVSEDSVPEEDLSAQVVLSGDSGDEFFEDDVRIAFDVLVTDDDEGALDTYPVPGGQLSFVEGGSMEISVRLSARPLSEDVVVTITPGDAALLMHGLPGGKLEYDSGNWDTYQMVTLSTAADSLAEDDFHTDLTVSLITADEFYQAAVDGDPMVFDVRVFNDDVAGIAFDPAGRVTLEVGGEQEYSYSLTSEPASGVDVRIALSYDAAALPDGIVLETVPASPHTETFGSADWSDEEMLAVRARLEDPNSEDGIELEEDVPFALEVSSSSTDPAYDGIEVTLRGVLRRHNAGAPHHVGRVVGLAAVGSAQFALDMVGNQLGGDWLGDPDLALARPSLSDDEDEAWAGIESGWREDFGSLIRGGASFRMPLGGGGIAGPSAVWGQVGYFDVSGESAFEGESVGYDGEALAGMYGVTWRGEGRPDLGVALSHVSSATDVGGGGRVVAVDQQLMGVHPYLGIEFGGGRRAWAVGSFGFGDIDVRLDDGSTVESESGSAAVGVGVEGRWTAGGTGLAARLEGLAVRVRLDDSEEFAGAGIVEDDGSPVESDAVRLRAEIEATRPFTLETGDTVYPYALAAVRHDGGELGGEQALELGGGFRAALADAYSIDLKVRLQPAGGGHTEHGLAGRVSYDAGRDGRGLVSSVSPDKSSVGYRWGASLFGHGGTYGPSLEYDSGDSRFTPGFGFDSDRLRMSVERDSGGVEARIRYSAGR